MKKDKITLAYGLYLDSNHRYIYDTVLSIISIMLYNKALIEKIVIYTNNADAIKPVFNVYFPKDIKDKIVYIEDTGFVDSIYNLCGKRGSHTYMTKGIFYRLQALTELKDFFYLDTDVICSGKLKVPAYKADKDIVKTETDSSCILYSKNGIDKKDLLYYVAYAQNHIATLEYPDECIIHDGFTNSERKEKPVNLYHFGNTEYLIHNSWSEETFLSLYHLLYSVYTLNDTKYKMPLNLFDSYFREPRPQFFDKIKKLIEDDSSEETQEDK